MIDTFHIIPASSRSLWIILGVLGGILLAVMGLLLASMYGARSSRFELSADGLRLRGDVYGRMVPASQLRGGSARPVDLTTERKLQPTMRTMGTSLGGYRSGWFRLANGEKALLYLTDEHHAVYIPTRAGYALLLSVVDPDRFLARLREIAPAE